MTTRQFFMISFDFRLFSRLHHMQQILRFKFQNIGAIMVNMVETSEFLNNIWYDITD